ncbi:Nuclear Rna Export Factor 5 [Manis pentadactyla]|nr:Nuclear Rna Export Factor 5 [Manis pentadactyla]
MEMAVCQSCLSWTLLSLLIFSSWLLGDLMTCDTEMAPNPRTCMAVSLPIHKENMAMLLPLNLSYKKPQQLNVLSNTMLKTSSIKNLNLSSNEVKSAGLLDKRKGLEPEEMRADSKPLCTTFQAPSCSCSPGYSSW